MESFHAASREYLITAYAARRMALRGISVRDVVAVLGHPAIIALSGSAPHRLVCRRTVDVRRLVVVVEGTPGLEPWEVVTAWEQGHHE